MYIGIENFVVFVDFVVGKKSFEFLVLSFELLNPPVAETDY